jgi:phage gp37-like protein
MKDFEFYVGGIEDTIIDILREGMPGVKNFFTYSGELDSDSVKKAISSLIPKFPLVLVAYTDGEDKRLPATPRVKGAPFHFRHDCSFAVICATNDARGDKARRRGLPTAGKEKLGCYQMMAKVRSLLSGLWLETVVENETVPLTHDPLLPVANDFMARLPNMTAYAVIFDTSFNYQTLDRRGEGTPVSNLDIDLSNQDSRVLPNDAPGVKL